jgi:hypothetical protein
VAAVGLAREEWTSSDAALPTRSHPRSRDKVPSRERDLKSAHPQRPAAAGCLRASPSRCWRNEGAVHAAEPAKARSRGRAHKAAVYQLGAFGRRSAERQIMYIGDRRRLPREDAHSPQAARADAVCGWVALAASSRARRMPRRVVAARRPAPGEGRGAHWWRRTRWRVGPGRRRRPRRSRLAAPFRRQRWNAVSGIHAVHDRRCVFMFSQSKPASN